MWRVPGKGLLLREKPASANYTCTPNMRLPPPGGMMYSDLGKIQSWKLEVLCVCPLCLLGGVGGLT